MKLIPLSDGWIEITSRVLKTEPRSRVNALDADSPRKHGLLRICSLCKRVPLETGVWVELETAIAERHLFDDARPPQLTHGLCPDCFQSTMAALENEIASQD